MVVGVTLDHQHLEQVLMIKMSCKVSCLIPRNLRLLTLPRKERCGEKLALVWMIFLKFL